MTPFLRIIIRERWWLLVGYVSGLAGGIWMGMYLK